MHCEKVSKTLAAAQPKNDKFPAVLQLVFNSNKQNRYTRKLPFLDDVAKAAKNDANGE